MSVEDSSVQVKSCQNDPLLSDGPQLGCEVNEGRELLRCKNMLGIELVCLVTIPCESERGVLNSDEEYSPRSGEGSITAEPQSGSPHTERDDGSGVVE